MSEESDDGAPSSPEAEADAALRGERFRAVKRAVLEARGFDSAARSAYLDAIGVATGDRSRGRVPLAQEASPNSHRRDGGPGAGLASQLSAALGHSAPFPIPSAASDPRTNRTGGMGIVYRALAAKPRPCAEEVALKVVRGGRTRNASCAVRVEAQALRSWITEHRSSVRRRRGRRGAPYFVMELVRATRSPFCETIRREHARPHPSVSRSLRGRTARAPERHHHRDPQASNVLVERRDDEALPKSSILESRIWRASAGGYHQTARPARRDAGVHEPEQAAPSVAWSTRAPCLLARPFCSTELLTGERPYRVESLTPVDIQRRGRNTARAAERRVARSPGAASVGLSPTSCAGS